MKNLDFYKANFNLFDFKIIKKYKNDFISIFLFLNKNTSNNKEPLSFFILDNFNEFSFFHFKFFIDYNSLEDNFIFNNNIHLISDKVLKNKVVELLSNNPEKIIRANIAISNEANKEILFKLSNDPSQIVREEVANNINIDKKTYLNLLSYNSSDINLALEQTKSNRTF